MAAPRPPADPQRARAVNTALNALRNALQENGQAPANALRLARVLLSRPGVTVGEQGQIKYQGHVFSPTSFANSPLAQLASGATAAQANQDAIKLNPDYVTAIAQLAMSRDQQLAADQAARQQALVQFGDPNMAGTDHLTAGAAQANPFSTVALLRDQLAQQLNAESEAAARIGVLGSGGAVSGQLQVQKANAAAEQQATTTLQNLLSQLSLTDSNANQAYTAGANQAAQNTYNALIAAGALHASRAPAWAAGHITTPWAGRVGTPGAPPAPRPPISVGTPPQGGRPPLGGGGPAPIPPPPTPPPGFLAAPRVPTAAIAGGKF